MHFFLIFLFYLSSIHAKTTSTGGYIYSDTTKSPIGGHHLFDLKLIEILTKSIPKHFRVADFGAGLGHYTKALRGAGIKVDSFDGAEGIEQASSGVVQFKDLAISNAQIDKYDFLISIEVGEHIPKQYENNFLNNILKTNASYILLSWAIPGQNGFHHVNNRPNSYIKSVMSEHGYKNDMIFETYLREVVQLKYLKNTLMFFTKTDQNVN